MATVNKELLEKYLELMKSVGDDDPECGHCMADDHLCELLKELGYGDVVDVFDDLTKWYA